MDERPELRLLFLTTENSKPSVERDMKYVGYVDVRTNESNISEEKWESSDSTNETENQNLNAYKINLSRKVSKKNGTMYLAVFSVPITNSKHSKGK